MKTLSADINTSSYTRFVLGDSIELLDSIQDESVDMVLTSPPYNIGKDYEKVIPIDRYLAVQKSIISKCVEKLRPGGSICWQVGFTKNGRELVPLDVILYPVFKELGLELVNRIVWTFGHGMHASKRFSGRHETILWFRKPGGEGYWDLDSVRVPQKYPGKKHYKGPKKGEYSGNVLGKNPGDVWDIPNVKAHHSEKTAHQCQFPIALAQRLIRALTPVGGVVLDPFAGVATTLCAATLESRQSIGFELFPKYHKIGLSRLAEAHNGTLKYRDISVQKDEPKPNTSLTTRKELQ